MMSNGINTIHRNDTFSLPLHVVQEDYNFSQQSKGTAQLKKLTTTNSKGSLEEKFNNASIAAWEKDKNSINLTDAGYIPVSDLDSPGYSDKKVMQSKFKPEANTKTIVTQNYESVHLTNPDANSSCSQRNRAP